ncbi:MAG: nitrogenase molybdenum-iron protein [Eubacterium sp.]|nr:nitrogenase molybdenum-iron protein [Eubacterium sp.]
MKKLLRYLSPFAPDQSGASGVLYELGGLIIICDAGGCAGNICGFDEPRWFTKKSAVFSAGLRDMDAIMGRDDKLIAKLAKAQESVNGKFTAIIATPVPAVIATDMKALKRMAEKKIGIPCITINAIGTRYYDEGEEEAWLSLAQEFAGTFDTDRDEDKNTESPEGSDTIKIIKNFDFSNKTLVLGASPLETGYTSSGPLEEACRAYQIEEPVILGMTPSDDSLTALDLVRASDKYKEILIVSPAGLKAAKYLNATYGIPYKVGYPFIPERVIKDLKAAIASDKDNRAPRILIIHSQFAANQLRNNIIKTMSDESFNPSIDCASFFMQSPDYMEEKDFRLNDEDQLFDIAANNSYDYIVGDKDIKLLLKAAGFKGTFIEYNHYAISGEGSL